MKCMTLRSWILGTVVGVKSTIALAATDSAPQPPVSLVRMEAEADDKLTMVTLRLSGKSHAGSLSVEEHGTFLQIVVPQAIVASPGEFVDAAGPYVRKMAAFQIRPSDAGVRLFVSEAAEAVAPASKVDVFDDRVVVSIDHASIQAHLAQSKIAAADSQDPAKIVAATEVSAVPAPASLIAEDKAGNAVEAEVAGTAAESASKLNPLSPQVLQRVGLFLGALMLLALAAARLAPYLRNRRVAKEAAAQTMRTVATFALMPKQNLTLIEVCDQKILLAVSPSGVQYITTIEPRPPSSVRVPRQSSFQQALALAGGSGAAVTGAKAQVGRLGPASAAAGGSRSEDGAQGVVLEALRRRERKDLPGEAVMDGDRPAAPVAPKAKRSTAASGGESHVARSEGSRAPVAQETRKSGSQQASGAGLDDSVDDVTRLIREKLKKLRSL